MATWVLIPGAGGDPWDWHLLAPELERRGHEAIAVRLPVGDDSAGWSEYTEAVIEAIDAVGERSQVAVVAESMGAFTAPIVCTRRPVNVLVLINGMIPVPGETFNAWWSNTGAVKAGAAYHASIGLSAEEAAKDEVVYYHDLPADLRAEALARPPGVQSSTPLDEPWPLPTWPDVPTRVLAGRLDRMFPLEFQRRVARERLGIEVDEVDGGHMVALSNPVGVADGLEASLRAGVRSD
jgi:pimeloyl-ACP methyl ester carboxylesterase